VKRAPAPGWIRRHARKVRFAGLAVLLLLALVGIRAAVRHLSFFAVRRIEVVGGRYLDAATVAAALELKAKTNLFDPKDQWVDRVKRLPGVIDAQLSRRLPGTLRIRIQEAEPVALARRGDRLVLVDEFASTLPFDPARPAADLPLATPDSIVTGLLARIRDLDPDLFGRIQRGSRIRGDVALELEQGRLYLRGEAEAADIQAVTVVADLLARDGRPWRELDARYLPRIVVRTGGRV
jgi:cell division septal protein FtsQ